jgi:hypothetical protein
MIMYHRQELNREVGSVKDLQNKIQANKIACHIQNHAKDCLLCINLFLQQILIHHGCCSCFSPTIIVHVVYA